MIKVLAAMLPLALCVLLALVGCQEPLIRGIADGMLVSPARPALGVRPHADFELVEAHRADLSPPVQGSALPSTSVQIVYALYENRNANPPARLSSMIAVTEDSYLWTVQPETKFPILRTQELIVNGYDGYAETFIIPADKDWTTSLCPSQAPWDEDLLVRRYTFTLWFQRARLIIEYREPLASKDIFAKTLPLADNFPLLATFENRAHMSFRILNGEKTKLPRPAENPPYPPSHQDRQVLITALGGLTYRESR